MDDLNLKDCPFCGFEPKTIHIGNYATKAQKIQVKCSGCRITRTDAILNRGPHDMEWLKGVAEKNWNQRPPTDESGQSK